MAPSDRYHARSASDKAADWPFWFVADRRRGGMNVTSDVTRAYVAPAHKGATLTSRKCAVWLAELANDNGVV